MTIKEIYENMNYGPAPENTDLAQAFLEKYKSKFDLFINGKWQKPETKMYFDTINPSTDNPLAKIAEGGPKDVDKAIKAAQKALPVWSGLSGHQRARYLYALARQIQKHARLFAVLESLDNGKPIRETRDIDIPLVARHFYHHAGWAQLMETQLKDYKEVGVIGQIIPWNFPLLMLSWKIAPALAMGNTVVLKPAESTPLTALLFAEICQNINLPAGVVNIVTGDGATGAEIVNHKDVDKIAFTGSTDVGKIIRRAIAGSGKKLSLELGGKSPFIVLEDADLDSAIEGIVDAIWFNQGEVCCAGSRLLVQESISEKFYDKLKWRMQSLRVGNALDKTIDVGAVIDKKQCQNIEKYVKIGTDEGLEKYQSEQVLPKEGFYYKPTLFTGASPASVLAREEIFGPVLVAMTFRTFQEAIKLANNTRYGLACSIWTENINLALDIAPQIKAGIAWINCSNVFDAAAGFGGYKESGFGREGGMEGLYEYVKPKINKTLSTSPVIIKKSKKVPTSSMPTAGYDRTIKLYIGGAQKRPDGGYAQAVKNPNGQILAEVGLGNRKDIRNAVEAAHAQTKWSNMTGHARAQVLYFIAENFELRKDEFANRLIQMTHCTQGHAEKEVAKSIERIYTYAAWADKYDGKVHSTVHRFVTLAMPEALGVMGVVCPEESPLLGFVSTVLPAIAMGNNVVVLPSKNYPLAATDFVQVFETSDLPAGTVNIVTGDPNELMEVLAKHDDVDGLWYFGTQEGSRTIETLATDNMKRTWVNYGRYRNWLDDTEGAGEIFVRKATQIKNIWIPYGG